jgi:hypothetical protein
MEAGQRWEGHARPRQRADNYGGGRDKREKTRNLAPDPNLDRVNIIYVSYVGQSPLQEW